MTVTPELSLGRPVKDAMATQPVVNEVGETYGFNPDIIAGALVARAQDKLVSTQGMDPVTSLPSTIKKPGVLFSLSPDEASLSPQIKKDRLEASALSLRSDLDSSIVVIANPFTNEVAISLFPRTSNEYDANLTLSAKVVFVSERKPKQQRTKVRLGGPAVFPGELARTPDSRREALETAALILTDTRILTPKDGQTPAEFAKQRFTPVKAALDGIEAKFGDRATSRTAKKEFIMLMRAVSNINEMLESGQIGKEDRKYMQKVQQNIDSYLVENGLLKELVESSPNSEAPLRLYDTLVESGMSRDTLVIDAYLDKINDVLVQKVNPLSRSDKLKSMQDKVPTETAILRSAILYGNPQVQKDAVDAFARLAVSAINIQDEINSSSETPSKATDKIAELCTVWAIENLHTHTQTYAVHDQELVTNDRVDVWRTGKQLKKRYGAGKVGTLLDKALSVVTPKRQHMSPQTVRKS